MTKEQYLRVIESVIRSTRNDLQKIAMLQQGFKLYVAERDEQQLRAQWVVPDKNYPETCSHCMFEYTREEDDGYLPKYCPECGAIMDDKVYHLYL